MENEIRELAGQVMFQTCLLNAICGALTAERQTQIAACLRTELAAAEDVLIFGTGNETFLQALRTHADAWFARQAAAP